MVLDCYPVLHHRLSGTDLRRLARVTIGLQTRTQSEGSGLSCCLCPCIALATVARSQTFLLAPKGPTSFTFASYRLSSKVGASLVPNSWSFGNETTCAHAYMGRKWRPTVTNSWQVWL